MRFAGLQSLRRNWHLAILGLLFTICLVVAAIILVPAKYVATTQMLLLPPLSQRDNSLNGIVNPYLGIDSLDSMANVVSLAMTDDETAQAMKKAGVSQYTVDYESLSAGPVLLVQAEDSSPKKASDALAVVTNQVPVTLARLQKEAFISPSAFVNVQVIARPSTPVKSGKTQLRAVGFALVTGLVLTFLAVSFVDGWRTRRLQAPAENHPLRESDGRGNGEATWSAQPSIQRSSMEIRRGDSRE
jgi:hypothetical protein